MSNWLFWILKKANVLISPKLCEIERFRRNFRPTGYLRNVLFAIFKKFSPPQKRAAILNFRIFAQNGKTQICFYLLNRARYCPDKILKVKITTVRSKVKSRSHHDIAHLQLPTNVPTKYSLPTHDSFQDIPGQNFIGQGHYGNVKGQVKVTP